MSRTLNARLLFTDFGLFRGFTDASCSTTIGTVNGIAPRYCAPEVALHEARNSSSDIWSLGVVYLVMTAVLKWMSMVQVDRNLRPSAASLVTSIEAATTNADSDADSVFCGMCCLSARPDVSDESDELEDDDFS